MLAAGVRVRTHRRRWSSRATSRRAGARGSRADRRCRRRPRCAVRLRRPCVPVGSGGRRPVAGSGATAPPPRWRTPTRASGIVATPLSTIVAAAGVQGRTGCARAPCARAELALDVDRRRRAGRRARVPAPVRSRRRRASAPLGAPDAMESLEQPRQLLLGECRPRCPRRSARPSPSTRRSADGDLALERELEGVGEQVEDDLLPRARGRRRPGRRAACTRLAAEAPRARPPIGTSSRCRSSRARGRLARRPGRGRPESICAKSISELTSRASRRALRAATSTSSLVSGRRPCSRAHRLSEARISVIGVRSSWLTSPKNAFFSRSRSSSAAARRCRNSRASASAIAAPTSAASSSRKSR